MPLESRIKDSAQTMLRVLRYPPVESGMVLPRAAAHEDINFLTIMPASDGPGLELQLSDGEWIEVVNRPSQVVVNIGDMLQEATEGFLRSTTHRVATLMRDSRRVVVCRCGYFYILHLRQHSLRAIRQAAILVSVYMSSVLSSSVQPLLTGEPH